MAQTMMADALRRGLRLGLYYQAADHEFVDLGAALQTVLDTSNAGEAYFAGTNPFLDDRLPQPGDELQNEEFVTHFKSSQDDPSPTSPGGDLDPADAAALQRHNQLWYQTGRFKEALSQLDTRRTAQRWFRIEVPRVYASEDEIREWRSHFETAMDEFAASDNDPIDAYNALRFHQTMPLAYHGYNDKALLEKQGRILCDGISARALPEFSRTIEKRKPGGKLRLGYLSANMKNSNGCRWAHGWLKNHAEDIETFALNVGPIEDFVTARFRKDADHYYHLPRGVQQVAKFVKDLQLDVLIFTDIGLNGRNLQYATLRLAPTQCTAWGHSETSGLPTIDYYLSSDLMEPANAQEHYAEKLIRLPKTGLCYPLITTEVATDLQRPDFGLPEGLVYLVPHTVPFCVPRHDHLYREINERSGRPIAFIGGHYPSDDVIGRKRIADAGINAIWIPLQPRSKYLRLMQLCEVVLDTPSWSGGNTSIEALNYGKPVITWPGELMRGRHAFSFAQVAGVPDLIARDAADYVDLACDLDRQNKAMAAPVRALDEFLRSVAFA